MGVRGRTASGSCARCEYTRNAMHLRRSPIKLTAHRRRVPGLGLSKVRWPLPGEDDVSQPPLQQRACTQLREALPLELSNIPREPSDECPPLQRGRQCSTPLEGNRRQWNHSGAFAEQALSPLTAMQREQAHCRRVPSLNLSRVQLPGEEPQPPLLQRFFSPAEEVAAPTDGGTRLRSRVSGLSLRSRVSGLSLDLSSISLELSSDSSPLRQGRDTSSIIADATE